MFFFAANVAAVHKNMCASNFCTLWKFCKTLVLSASVSKPWKELGVRFLDILQWRNLSQSLLVFLVSTAMWPACGDYHNSPYAHPWCCFLFPWKQIYMYSVWNGWIIQMLLLFAIIRLTLNYLYIMWAAHDSSNNVALIFCFITCSGIAEHFGFQPPKRTLDVWWERGG